MHTYGGRDYFSACAGLVSIANIRCEFLALTQVGVAARHTDVKELCVCMCVDESLNLCSDYNNDIHQ